MQGNVGGGGGGAALAHMLVHHPVESAIGFGLMGTAAVVGFLGYQAAVMYDMPEREPAVAEIVDHSIQVCANAEANGGLYSIALKNDLTAVWSSQLKEYLPAAEKAPICEEPALNNFVLPYKYDKVGTTYTGEFRVLGLAFTYANGGHAYTVKTPSDVRAANSIDDQPDGSYGIAATIEGMNSLSKDVHQVTLKDGTTVAAYLQQDGVTQAHGSKNIYDNDGMGWADAAQMQEILSHFQPVSPLYAGILPLVPASVPPPLTP